MTGIQNFLFVLNEYWTSILVCIGLIAGIVKKTSVYFKKDREAQITAAKSFAKEVILDWVSNAEINFAETSGAGKIKRAQVIYTVFSEFPILSKVADQEALIAWIDDEIDNALGTLKDIIEKE